MSAPKPANFRSLADAWDSPVAFATELARYYSQLEGSGYRLPAPEITAPMIGDSAPGGDE